MGFGLALVDVPAATDDKPAAVDILEVYKPSSAATAGLSAGQRIVAVTIGGHKVMVAEAGLAAADLDALLNAAAIDEVVSFLLLAEAAAGPGPAGPSPPA
eukprot:SAG22_NODE_1106_length_5552_cov_3.049331_1_plen_100_part_00